MGSWSSSHCKSGHAETSDNHKGLNEKCAESEPESNLIPGAEFVFIPWVHKGYVASRHLHGLESVVHRINGIEIP